MRRCPYCAEYIQDEAVKCPHCLSLLTHPAVSSGSIAAATILVSGAVTLATAFLPWWQIDAGSFGILKLRPTDEWLGKALILLAILLVLLGVAALSSKGRSSRLGIAVAGIATAVVGISAFGLIAGTHVWGLLSMLDADTRQYASRSAAGVLALLGGCLGVVGGLIAARSVRLRTGGRGAQELDHAPVHGSNTGQK